MTDAILRLRKRGPAVPLSVLTYHSVANGPFPGLDPDVVDATPDDFDRQMQFAARHFNVVGVNEVIDAVNGERALPGNPLLITFDDGYKSCLETALPILQRWNLRACFFIATDFVDERRLYWWDRISYLIEHSQRPAVAARKAERRAEALNAVKNTPGLDIEGFLGDLAAECGVAWTREVERDIADKVIMTWDEVRALRAAGMDVQSHTRSHRVLQTLAASDLAHELTGSREILEARLEEPIRAIAYPVGRAIAEIPAIRKALVEAGYEVGFSNASGVTYRPGSADRYDVRRLAVDPELSMELFEASLAVPPLAYTR